MVDKINNNFRDLSKICPHNKNSFRHCIDIIRRAFNFFGVTGNCTRYILKKRRLFSAHCITFPVLRTREKVKSINRIKKLSIITTTFIIDNYTTFKINNCNTLNINNYTTFKVIIKTLNMDIYF